MRKRVTFGGDNWEFLLGSVGDCIYFKYPLVYILPYWNFLLFKNWLSLDIAYNGFCLFAGFIMFIQMFRLWNLLWPSDMMRRIYGRLLTMIPYGTAQFFFGYSGRRVIELAFFTSLIYYAVLLIKKGKGFFWIGLLTALTFSSHVVHILTVPAIALACYLASAKERLHKKMFYGAQCITGFLLGYVVVYGYIGNLKVLPTILFNHNSSLVQEELLAKVGSFRNMFDISFFDHFKKVADIINSYGPIGFLLIVVMWFSPGKKLFIGNKNIAIFLGVLAAICVSWFPWKQYIYLWVTFDQFASSFIILNIFAVYMWLAGSKNVKEFILPASILIAVFGTYSVTLIGFTHRHRHDINVSFKGNPQSVL